MAPSLADRTPGLAMIATRASFPVIKTPKQRYLRDHGIARRRPRSAGHRGCRAAARHVFIWGRRPDRRGHLRSHLTQPDLARLQALLSGY